MRISWLTQRGKPTITPPSFSSYRATAKPTYAHARVRTHTRPHQRARIEAVTRAAEAAARSIIIIVAVISVSGASLPTLKRECCLGRWSVLRVDLVGQLHERPFVHLRRQRATRGDNVRGLYAMNKVSGRSEAFARTGDRQHELQSTRRSCPLHGRRRKEPHCLACPTSWACVTTPTLPLIWPWRAIL